MTVYGLDGCHGGWAVVGLAADKPTFDVIEDLGWLLSRKPACVMIDMPIGLPQIGLRQCDLRARAALKPHASRVFTGAQRFVLSDDDQRTVNAKLKARGHGGISIQLANLRPKIAAVDRFVRDHRDLDIRECHPELVFRRLNEGEPLVSKHHAEGLARRRKLLLPIFPALDDWLLAHNRKGAKPDDVLDACACAIAARDRGKGHCLPPSEAERDACGIPMQIWY